VAGHGRKEAYEGLKVAGKPPPARVRVAPDGDWLVPVLRGAAFKDDKEAEAYLLADNRVGELGGWDDLALADMLVELSPSDGEMLAGTGFDQSLVDGIQAARRANAGAAPPVTYKEFDESAADDVRYVECPQCKHNFPV
jgi:hypothetical protein